MGKFNWNIFSCFKTKKNTINPEDPPYSSNDGKNHETGGVYMGQDSHENPSNRTPASQNLDIDQPSTSAVVQVHSPEVPNQLSGLQHPNIVQLPHEMPTTSQALYIATISNNSYRQADFVPDVPNNTPEHRPVEFSGTLSVERSDL